MTAVVPASPKVQFCDALGVPLAVGTVDVYLAGTVTRTTTWQDQTKLSANVNPIVLDSRGECVIWGDSSVTYKYTLKNAAGVEQYTVDNIPGAASLATLNAALAEAIAAVQAQQVTSVAAVAAAQATAVAAVNTLVTDAETAETSAEASATLAANYAAAAATGAKFYNTIALGNAGVADAATFGVIAGGSDSLLRPSIYRRESAGVSTLLYAVLPAAEYDRRSRTTLSGGFAIGDADGNLVVQVAAASGLKVSSRGIETNQIGMTLRSLKYRLGLADADGNLRFALDSSGRYLGDVSQTVGRTNPVNTGTYDYDVNFYPIYGQSLSVGQATPVLSTVQKHDNLMFVDGMRPQYDHVADSDAVRYASFVPAVEAQSGVDATLAETPCTASGEMVKQLMLSEDGLGFASQSYQLLHSTPGFGATSISGLSKGGAHWTRLMSQVTYGTSVSATANKTFAVQAMAWMQGESDYPSTTQAAYYAAMNTLVSDLNTDAKAITGQTKNIPLISYQVASHKVGGSSTPTIALAQLQAEGANALIYMACPMYQFDYQSVGNFHLMADSSRWLGAYLGLAYKRIVIDGQAWSPVQPISSTRSGKLASIKFRVPIGALVLDTTQVALNTNYGFELVDSVNSPLTISSVSLRGSDTVKVTAAATIPAGAKLRYAWSGTDNVGRISGPRGNLRDSQGDFLVFDPTGLNKRMDNWCVIFEWPL